jgi:hypothetical protein
MNDGFFFLSSSSMCLALTITYDDDALQSQAGGLMHVEYIYIYSHRPASGGLRITHAVFDLFFRQTFLY